MQIIVFTLGEKYYAFKTDKVLEISRKIKASKVPNSPDWIEGLVNLRGNIVTMVNISKILQLDSPLCYNKFIILQEEDEKIGIMVTEVSEVVTIAKEDLQVIQGNNENAIVGIVELDKKIVNIIDIKKMRDSLETSFVTTRN